MRQKTFKDKNIQSEHISETVTNKLRLQSGAYRQTTMAELISGRCWYLQSYRLDSRQGKSEVFVRRHK